MSREYFTSDQIEVLKKNPYTKTVTPYQIRFTDSFKEFFWERFMEGINPADIFKEAGYNPGLIGNKRIANVRQLVVNRHKELIHREDSSMSKKLEQMDSRMKVMEAQLEALKKIIILANSKR